MLYRIAKKLAFLSMLLGLVAYAGPSEAQVTASPENVVVDTSPAAMGILVSWSPVPGATSYTVTATANENEIVSAAQRVRRCYAGIGVPAHLKVTDTSCRIRLDSLTAGATYQVQVRAQNNKGRGPASQPVEATVRLVERVSTAPGGVVANVDAFPGRIVVSWNELASTTNTPIDGYRVVGTTSGGDTVSCISNSAEITACVLQPMQLEVEDEERSPTQTRAGPPVVQLEFLEAGTVYDVQVRAFNTLGDGPASSTITATPSAASQSAPTVAPSFADVNFNYFANSPLYVNWGWEYLDEHYSSINPPLQGYIVQATAGDDGTVQECRVEDIFGFECIFTNVRDGVEYSVRIAAFNSVGVGTFSAPVTRRSLSGKPTAAPTGLAVDAVSEPGNVIVSWDALPAEQAGAVPVHTYVATAIAVSGADVGPSQRRVRCFAGPDPG